LVAAGRLREASCEQMASWIIETLNSLEVGMVMQCIMQMEQDTLPK